MKKKSLLKMLLYMTLVVFSFSCSKFNDLPDELENSLDLSVKFDLKATSATVNILNGNDGTTIKAPVSLNVLGIYKGATSITDPAALINIDGTRLTATTFSGGVMQFGLNKTYLPSDTAQYDIVAAIASGQFKNDTAILTFTNQENHEFNISLTPIPSDSSVLENPDDVEGLAVDKFILVGVQNDSGELVSEQKLAVTLVQENELLDSVQSLETVVTLPAKTKFFGENGKTLVGDIAVRVGYFDASNENALENFPGGLEIIESLRKYRMQTRDGDTGSFVSAGFVALDMTVGGEKVDSFNQSINVDMEVSDSLINPMTGQPITGNDSIDVWSYDGVKWKKEGNSKFTTSRNGKKKISIQPNHLSYWNLDWKYTRVCNPRVIVQGVPLGQDLWITLSFNYNGRVRNYYFRKMSPDGANRWMQFYNSPVGVPIQYKVSTQRNGTPLIVHDTTFAESLAGQTFEVPLQFPGDAVFSINVEGRSSENIPPNSHFTIKTTQFSADGLTKEHIHSLKVQTGATPQQAINSIQTLLKGKQYQFSIYYRTKYGVLKLLAESPKAVPVGNISIPIVVPVSYIPRLDIQNVGTQRGRIELRVQVQPKNSGTPRPSKQYTRHVYVYHSNTSLSLHPVNGGDVVTIEAVSRVGAIYVKVAETKSFTANSDNVIPFPVNLNVFANMRINLTHTNPALNGMPLFVTAHTRKTTTSGSSYLVALGTGYSNGNNSITFSQIPLNTEVTYNVLAPIFTAEGTFTGLRNVGTASLTAVAGGPRIVTIAVNDALIPVYLPIPVQLQIDCPDRGIILPTVKIYYRIDNIDKNNKWKTAQIVDGQTSIQLRDNTVYEFAIYDPYAMKLRSGTKLINQSVLSSLINIQTDPEFAEMQVFISEFCAKYPD